jgi:8-amino-7-oxononanoate synthase
MKIVEQNISAEQRRKAVMEIITRQHQMNHKPVQQLRAGRMDAIHANDFNIRNFSTYPEIMAFDKHKSIIAQCKVENPYFRINEKVINSHARIDGKELISFSCYNYLGYSGEPFVTQKAKLAIDQFGTSPSASRVVTGEKPIHGELERAIAQFIGAEDALVFANGHATNVTVIGHFFNNQDLIIYDELSHNSVLEGCLLSGSRRMPFPHNDFEKCEKIIAENINNYQKIVMVIEGAYSMDGDIAPLDEFVKLRRKYPVLLYVDEAHSLGTVGETGRGVSEYFNISAHEVDFWMGTLSKSLASNGGYIAGKHRLIDYLKYTTPGFVYSAGITPANAAASLASLELLQASSERVKKLQSNAHYFRYLARSQDLNIGSSKDTPIVPIIVGDSHRAITLADTLFKHGISVHPMFHPAVPMGEARLRFFITSEHTQEDIAYTVKTLAMCLA